MATVTMPSGWIRLTVNPGALNLAPMNAAPAASWNALIAALQSGPLAGRKVVFNIAGERLPNQQKDWTPAAVSDFCRSGGVWIDYCGGPMYYSSDPSVTGSYGWPGFQKFLTAAGAYGLPYSNFDTSTISSGFGQTYPYQRSLVLKSAPPQVSWFDPNLRAANARPYKTGTVAGNFWVYASFAIMVGSGMYCYAYGGLRSNLGFSYQAGVPASTYAAFINGAAAAMGHGVVPVTTSGGGAPSNPGTPSGTVAPPSGLHVVSTTTTSATFGWNSVSGATSIQIGRVISGSVRLRATLAGVAETVTLTGLTPGSSVTIVVRDTIGGKTSAWSSPVTATAKTATTSGGGTSGGSTGGSSGGSSGGSTGGGGMAPTSPGGTPQNPVIPATGNGFLSTVQSMSTTDKVVLGTSAAALLIGAGVIISDR